MLDAHVDDDDARARVARQHVDGRAAAREVEQHLPGHLLRVGADPFVDDAVVRAHHDDRLRGRVGAVAPRMAAIWQTRSSSRPRLRRGLVLSSSSRCASAAARCVDGDDARGQRADVHHRFVHGACLS